MANKWVSFFGGLGKGGLDEYHRQQDRERQERQDAQDKELHDIRMRTYQGALDDAEQKRQGQQAMRDAVQPVEPEGGFQVQDAFTKDEDAAGVLADMAGESQAQPMLRVRGVGAPRFFDHQGEGLKAAQDYASEQNTPEGMQQRWLRAYTQLNPDKAFEAQEYLEKFNQAKYDASRQWGYRQGVQAIRGGDFGAIAKLVKPYLGGGDITFSPSSTGGGEFVVTNPQGQIIHTVPANSAEELEQTLYGYIFPDKVREQKEKLAAEQRTQQGKIEVERAKAGFGAARDVANAQARAWYGSARDSGSRSSPRQSEDVSKDMASIRKLVEDRALQENWSPSQFIQELNKATAEYNASRMLSQGVSELQRALRVEGRSPQEAWQEMVRFTTPEVARKIFETAGIAVPTEHPADQAAQTPDQAPTQTPTQASPAAQPAVPQEPPASGRGSTGMWSAPTVVEQMEQQRQATAGRRAAQAVRDAEAFAAGQDEARKITPQYVKSLTGTAARKLRNGPLWRHLDAPTRRLVTVQASRSD